MKYIINTKQGKLDVTELVEYCQGRPDPDPVIEIIYYVSYCLIKADISMREDILNDTLGLLYFAKSLINTIHDIKRGERSSLIVENFFDNYYSTWGEEILSRTLKQPEECAKGV